MKIVKLIDITFGSTASYSATANVHVPFGVKFCNIKVAAYVAVTPTVKFVSLSSDMTENQPVALLCQDNSITLVNQDISIEYPVPKVIQGTYTFYLRDIGGAHTVQSTGADLITLICEFADENSYPGPPQILHHQLPFPYVSTTKIV